jgi:hypothetical protein
MGISPVINALLEKRSEIMGRLLEIERTVAALETQLNHLDATLVMFHVNPCQMDRLPKRPYRRRLEQFEPGEMTRLTLDFLRRSSEPLSTRELTVAIMDSKNIEEPDMHTQVTISREMLRVLMRLRLRKLVERTGVSRAAKWRIVEQADSDVLE